ARRCRHRRALSEVSQRLATLVLPPLVDVAAHLPLGRERNPFSVPELHAVPRARLAAHRGVRAAAVVLLLFDALPAGIPDAVLGRRVLVDLAVPVFAVAVVVPDDLPQLLLAVVREAVQRLEGLLVDVDVLVVVRVVFVLRDEANDPRVAHFPAVTRV